MCLAKTCSDYAINLLKGEVTSVVSNVKLWFKKKKQIFSVDELEQITFWKKIHSFLSSF